MECVAFCARTVERALCVLAQLRAASEAAVAAFVHIDTNPASITASHVVTRTAVAGVAFRCWQTLLSSWTWSSKKCIFN